MMFFKSLLQSREVGDKVRQKQTAPKVSAKSLPKNSSNFMNVHHLHERHLLCLEHLSLQSRNAQLYLESHLLNYSFFSNNHQITAIVKIFRRSPKLFLTEDFVIKNECILGSNAMRSILYLHLLICTLETYLIESAQCHRRLVIT